MGITSTLPFNYLLALLMVFLVASSSDEPSTASFLGPCLAKRCQWQPAALLKRWQRRTSPDRLIRTPNMVPKPNVKPVPSRLIGFVVIFSERDGFWWSKKEESRGICRGWDYLECLDEQVFNGTKVRKIVANPFFKGQWHY